MAATTPLLSQVPVLDDRSWHSSLRTSGSNALRVASKAFRVASNVKVNILHWWHVTSSDLYLTSKLSRRTAWSWYLPYIAVMTTVGGFFIFFLSSRRADTTFIVALIIMDICYVIASCLGKEKLMADVLISISSTAVAVAYLRVFDINSTAGGAMMPFMALHNAAMGMHSLGIAFFCIVISMFSATDPVSSQLVACLVPLLCFATAGVAVVSEYLAASLLLQSEAQLESMERLLDSATDGFCRIDTTTNTIASASSQLMQTLNEEQLIGSSLCEFVLEEDATNLNFSCPKAGNIKERLSPVMVTCCQKASGTATRQSIFEARVVPYAFSDTHLDVFLNVLGERRYRDLPLAADLSSSTLPPTQLGTVSKSATSKPLLTSEIEDTFNDIMHSDAQSCAGSISSLAFSITAPSSSSSSALKGTILSSTADRLSPCLEESTHTQSCSVATQTLDVEQLVSLVQDPSIAQHGLVYMGTVSQGTQTHAARPPQPTTRGAPKLVLNTRRRVHKDFKATPQSTWMQLIKDFLFQVNPRGSGCCAMHVGLHCLQRRVQDLIAHPCDPHMFAGFSSAHYTQCPQCLAIEEVYADDSDVMCKYCFAEITVGAAHGQSSSSTADVADKEPTSSDAATMSDD